MMMKLLGWLWLKYLGRAALSLPVLLYHLTQIGFSGRWFACLEALHKVMTLGTVDGLR
jgi:hypothetical protein